jgi:hypothetical protein
MPLIQVIVNANAVLQMADYWMNSFEL